MIGSGKSTTAERLAAKLIASGATARAFNEGADDHPVRTRSVDRLLGKEEGHPGAYAAEQWNALAERCTHATGTTIVESTFLQNTVMPHFIDGEPRAVMEAVFADVAARVAPQRRSSCISDRVTSRARSGGSTPSAASHGRRATTRSYRRVHGRAVVACPGNGLSSSCITSGNGSWTGCFRRWNRSSWSTRSATGRPP
jgi:hypothetical protein